MSHIKTLISFTIFLLLAACVTINVYFPAAAADSAARTIVRDVLGLPLSLGAAVNTVRRAQPQFDAAAQAILATIRDSAVVGSDETGARVADRNAWQWVFQTPDSVYFTIESRRNAAVIHSVMGNHSPVTWISDLAAAQLKHPALELQICLAHQVRDLQWEIDTRRCAWAYRLQALLYRAMRLGNQRDQIHPAW